MIYSLDARSSRFSRRASFVAVCSGCSYLYGLRYGFAQRVADGEPGALQAVAAKFDIEIVTSGAGFPIRTTHGFIHGKAIDRDALVAYEPLFSGEFTRYPKQLVTATKLRKVVLCEDLSFDGQRRNAVPDFEHNTLYLDAKRGDHSPLYQRKVIHHEFFHMIDFADDGKLYEDAAWTTLNAADFRYGSGGRNAQDNASTSVLTDRYPGFLNHYSTTGVEEDKAEVFANLMVEPQRVLASANSDPVVQNKVAAMKTLLKSFCGAMNSEFWATIERTK